MMGGSGGSGFRSSQTTDELRAEVHRALQQARADSDVNALLAEQLASISNRDVELVTQRLDAIVAALGDRIEDIDRLLYGGSVAKHTYVDGLSDVDSLVVLKASMLEADSPQALRAAMERALRQGLDMSQVTSIVVGFAVTVRYNDGSEIQLLPAVERGGRIAIPDKQGTGWSFIRPKEFRERLTAANKAQDGRLVPTIKLAKAVVDASLPESDRPGGYHMEALAIEAFRGYDGPRTSKVMLTRFFSQAAARIQRPIADSTGQSPRIDEVFGEAGSAARRGVSESLRQIASRMQAATTVEEWRALFE